MATNHPAEAREARSGRMRLDKWLWAARFYKTRALAARAIETGQARIAEARVKPAHPVRDGDRISVRKDGLVRQVFVLAVAERRGSASEAAKLYAETPESLAAREQALLARKAAGASEPHFAGRPTKRDRRRLADFLDEP